MEIATTMGRMGLGTGFDLFLLDEDFRFSSTDMVSCVGFVCVVPCPSPQHLVKEEWQQGTNVQQDHRVEHLD